MENADHKKRIFARLIESQVFIEGRVERERTQTCKSRVARGSQAPRAREVFNDFEGRGCGGEEAITNERVSAFAFQVLADGEQIVRGLRRYP